mgnify:CR=1 FL=1
MYRLLAALAHLVTDAKMRPEVKLVLGIPILVAAVIYGIASRDWVGFGALSGVALVLLGITAAADAQIDKGA